MAGRVSQIGFPLLPMMVFLLAGGCPSAPEPLGEPWVLDALAIPGVGAHSMGAWPDLHPVVIPPGSASWREPSLATIALGQRYNHCFFFCQRL